MQYTNNLLVIIAASALMHIHLYVDDKGGSKIAGAFIGLFSAFLITIIILVSIAPKILCRHCHDNKEDNNSDEDVHDTDDEVVYGEIRYPIETYNKQDSVACMSNPLHSECTKNHNAESVSSTEGNNCNYLELIASCERNVSQTPEIPPYCGSDDDDKIVKKFDSKQSITMTQNPSYRLKSNFLTEADSFNCTESVANCERGAAILPHNDNGNNDITMATHLGQSKAMTPNCLCHLERHASTEADNFNRTEFLPNCRGETGHIPSIPQYNKNDNIIKKSDSEQSIIMTQNPSYQFEKEFFS